MHCCGAAAGAAAASAAAQAAPPRLFFVPAGAGMRGLVGLGLVGLDLGGGVRAVASRFEPRASCSSVSSSDARAAAASCAGLGWTGGGAGSAGAAGVGLGKRLTGSILRVRWGLVRTFRPGPKGRGFLVRMRKRPETSGVQPGAAHARARHASRRLATRMHAHILEARCFCRSRFWLRSRLASWHSVGAGRRPAFCWAAAPVAARRWLGCPPVDCRCRVMMRCFCMKSFFVLLVPCSATSVSSANSFCAAHSGELRLGQSATSPCTTGMSAF